MWCFILWQLFTNIYNLPMKRILIFQNWNRIPSIFSLHGETVNILSVFLTCKALSTCICRLWRACSWSLEGENSPSLVPPIWFSTVSLKSWTSLLFSEITLSSSGFKRDNSSFKMNQKKSQIYKLQKYNYSLDLICFQYSFFYSTTSCTCIYKRYFTP